MVVSSLRKSAFDQVARALDFSALLPQGQTLSLASVTAQDAFGNDVTTQLIAASPAPAVSGAQLAFQIMGGTSGKQYLVVGRVSSSDGQKFEASIKVTVE